MRPLSRRERRNASTRLGGEAGQTATEYMLIISVIVIAVVAAAYSFIPGFRGGVQSLANDVKSILDTGMIGGVGKPRDGGGMYNTASNNARRCTEQANDPRYAAMFDPPQCIPDPVAPPPPPARERIPERRTAPAPNGSLARAATPLDGVPGDEQPTGAPPRGEIALLRRSPALSRRARRR